MSDFSFSFDCFSNVSSGPPASHESTLSEATSGHRNVGRSHSDSSTVSSKSAQPAVRVNRSVDDMRKRQQQLLKLSFFNSPNSPMYSSTFMNSTIADNVYQEAKSIAKKFGDFGDMSFEDLNNVSQHLIDASGGFSETETDFQDMKINIPNETRELHSPSSYDRIKLCAQLMRIKKEVESDDTEAETDENTEELELVPETDSPAKTDESDVEALWQKLKSVINEGSKDEAKKQLLRLNEALGKKPLQPEPKITMEVQPIIRQATFEIDPLTGNRKEEIKEQAQTVVSEDLLRQLSALLNGQSAGVHEIDLGAKNAVASKLAVVIVPAPVATPTKNMRLTAPIASRTQSAIKTPSAKKQGTPLKRLTQSSRRVSFTNPRPSAPSYGEPCQQKTLDRADVRKSLMGTIDKVPPGIKPKMTAATAVGVKSVPRPLSSAPRASVAPRRSSSLKLPDVKLTKPSPMKIPPIRPSTGAPYNKRLTELSATPGRAPTASRLAQAGRARMLSDHGKLVSEFKAPSVVRKAAAAAPSKESLV